MRRTDQIESRRFEQKYFSGLSGIREKNRSECPLLTLKQNETFFVYVGLLIRAIFAVLS